MNILAFVDVHDSSKALALLSEKAKEADILVCAGDISVFGRGLAKNLATLDSIGKPIIITHGNHEGEEEMRQACTQTNNIIYIHNEMVEVDDVAFLAYGGGGFSSHDTGFEMFAKQFAPRLKGKKVVLITHGPPYKTALDDVGGQHAGNKSYTNFITFHKPVLAVSGHIHENAGKQQMIGPTLVINPGPAGKLLSLS